MQCDPPTDRINSFSLVSYIPGRLGDFITRLRQELVAGCTAQSHVTILPPRPLFIDSESAQREVEERAAPFGPLMLSIPRIRTFEQTCVVFADIGMGREGLREMHSALNKGGLQFDEPFEYHPHITLAHGMPYESLHEMFEHARRRWNESAPCSSFMVETLTFVQNTIGNHWIDLAECELRGSAAALR